jgi:Secretion system C-terminal sorting domain
MSLNWNFKFPSCESPFILHPLLNVFFIIFNNKIMKQIYTPKFLKTLFVFALTLFFTLSSVAQVTIGTGTSVLRFPFSYYFGYTRDASIYTAAEMNTATVGGTITTISWYSSIASSTVGPTVIYLKQIGSTTAVAASDWATTITGATSVYSGTTANWVVGWNSIDITDYAIPAGQNLAVLVECNFTGGGTGGTTSTQFQFSTITNAHGVAQADNTPPAGNLTVNGNRPNVILGGLTPPSCLPPTALAITAITSSSATVNWVAASPIPSGGYQWAVTTSATPPASGTPIALLTANSTGLASITLHYLHVRSDCGAGTFSSWATSSFTTSCLADNIPYLMPITAVTTPALPLCTSIENIGNLPNTWISAGAASFGSTINAAYTMPVLAYVYNSTNPANDWLYTNGLNLIAGTSYTLKFKYSNDLETTYPEAMKVAYGTSNNSTAMINILANYPSIVGTTTNNANITFTPTSSGVYYIGFHAYSLADQDVLILDDIEVIVTPTCAPVTGLAVATTPTTANISWTAVPAAANGYEYVVDAVATSPTVAGTTVATNSVSVSGTYNIGTTYYAHVRSICSVSDFSPWTNLLFTPPPTCLVASDYLTPINGATIPYQPNVLISWNNVPSATSYDIYVEVGMPPTVATTLLGNLPATAGATSGAFLNTALPATQYVWYVVGKNAGGGALGCGLPRTYTTAAAAPIPANDDCGTAISLTVNANDLCAITTTGTTLGATASTETAPSCNATGTNDDVWYTFTATGTTHIINITGVSAGAVMSSQVYSGACGSLALVTGGCSSTFPYTITGLTASTVYTVRVNTISTQPNNQSNFVICVGAPPSAPPLNDDATGAITLTLGAGCTSLYSNALATASATEVFPSCSGTIQAPVWFKFVAPTSGAVRVSTDNAGGSFTDSKLAVFFATAPADYTTFSIISCDDDGGSAVGSGFLSVAYASGLTSGSTYYVAVDKYSASTSSGTFCITVDELNSTMLATTNTCTSNYQTPSANGATGYTGWIPLMDATSKLIAMVQQTAGASVSDFSVSQNINTAAVRTTGAVPYLDRSYRIASTQTNVNVQFFFLLTELAALNAIDGSVNITNLGGSKQTETVGTCNNNFVQANGAYTGFSQTLSTTANGVGSITITTPSFSNFYLHKQGAVLPSSDILTGSKQGNSNLLDWKLSCAGFAEITMVLERSTDRRTFAPLQQQTASAARCDQNFIYVDASPAAGINYYRIKIITPQGDVRYTDIVALINKGKGFELISLAPNPVKNTAILSLSSAIAGKVDITVIDFAGKTVSKESIKVIAGNNPITMDFAQLAAGTYTIIAKNTDGEMKTSRFVKD